MKIKLALLICLLCCLSMQGCQTSRQLETAAVIQSVGVSRINGQLCYTFYKLSSDEKPPKTVVPASSFEEACRKAGEQYIPHFSLAKLKMLLVHRELVKEVMRRDMEYISTRTYFSPVAYVCVCDDSALKALGGSAEEQREAEQQLLLCRQRHPKVKLSYISIYNCMRKNHGNDFDIVYLSSEKELRAEPMPLNCD